MPKGTKYNTDFFYNEVMPSLKCDIASRGRRETLRGLFIYMDNARLHNSGRAQECIRASKAERLPHPAYSPDLAPSDFFLFEDLKEKLTDYNRGPWEQLKEAIIEIFNEIPEDALVSVFMS
jgi:histone-lysine N-methyltransferase SETMAR